MRYSEHIRRPLARAGLFFLVSSGMLLVAVTNLQAASDDPIAWRNDFRAAVQEAQQSNKLLLVNFTASWCNPCQLMKKTTYRDASLADLVNRNFVAAMIDGPSNMNLVREMKVEAYPTVLLLTAEGKELSRMTGFLSADRMASALQRTVAVASSQRPASSGELPTQPQGSGIRGPLASANPAPAYNAPPASNPPPPYNPAPAYNAPPPYNAAPPYNAPPATNQPPSYGQTQGQGSGSRGQMASAAPPNYGNAGNPAAPSANYSNNSPASATEFPPPPPPRSNFQSDPNFARQARPDGFAPSSQPPRDLSATPASGGNWNGTPAGQPVSRTGPATDYPAPTAAAPPTAPAAPLALSGFCPVTMITRAELAQGNPQFQHNYRGMRFQFLTSRERDDFARNPDRFLPVNAGFCVVTLVERGQRVPGRVDLPALFEDRVYLFSADDARQRFLREPERYIDEQGNIRTNVGQ